MRLLTAVEIGKAMGARVIAAAALYVLPAVKIETDLWNSDKIMQFITYEETANIGNIAPNASGSNLTFGTHV